MVVDYITWQFVQAPTWLLQFLWNIERASLRFFSIKFMFKTLLAYWHKDAMAWRGGTITKYITTIMWNIVSRLIGFFVRTIVILSWVAVQIIYLPLALAVFLIFILWPLFVFLGLTVGLSIYIA